MLDMSSAPRFVAVQSKGTVVLPVDIRRRHGLDEPGAQVEVRERADGVIELVPQRAIPASQAWFWSERWQAMEVEVDRHVAAGGETVHSSGDAFLDHLEALESDS
jgi:bifunctional DNA-binding transcriptional regulator/antitoxin component of YhaV-PrlF toxin-antitoxin module